MRTLFDRASKLLDVDPNFPFSKKLQELQSSGHIGNQEREVLSILVDAGSAAAHRGWQPSPEQLEPIFDTMEQFLERSFVTVEGMKSIRVPSRQGGKNTN